MRRTGSWGDSEAAALDEALDDDASTVGPMLDLMYLEPTERCLAPYSKRQGYLCTKSAACRVKGHAQRREDTPPVAAWYPVEVDLTTGEIQNILSDGMQTEEERRALQEEDEVAMALLGQKQSPESDASWLYPIVETVVSGDEDEDAKPAAKLAAKPAPDAEDPGRVKTAKRGNLVGREISYATPMPKVPEEGNVSPRVEPPSPGLLGSQWVSKMEKARVAMATLRGRTALQDRLSEESREAAAAETKLRQEEEHRRARTAQLDEQNWLREEERRRQEAEEQQQESEARMMAERRRKAMARAEAEAQKWEEEARRLAQERKA